MDLTQAEARLPRWMLFLACAVTLALLLSLHVRLGAGFAVGSGLGILNYLWLHSIVEALVNAGTARPPKSALAKVIVRYPLMFAGVYLFYKAGWLPFKAILAGLFVPVGGVLIEALVLLRDGWKDAK
ncbi:MAG TPA: ATP synthase subunit I [Terriglobia bacterium]|nr:ATP synthase subunit I [Terriglobia bacterium]